MKYINGILFFVFSSIILFSCTPKSSVDSSASAQLDTDTKAILAYQTAHSLNLSTDSQTGVYYQLLTTNATGTVAASQYEALVSYKLRKLSSDSILVKGDSVLINWYLSSYFTNFKYSISLLKEGEKGQFFIPSSAAYNATNPPSGFANTDPVVAEIQLIKLLSEDDQINRYLKQNNLQNSATVSTSGLRFIRTNAKADSTVASLATSDVVVINYKGTFLDGTVFDSGATPLSYTVGVTGLISGFVEGIKNMKKGEKAKLVMPSTIAYGNTGSANSIPPYAPLVFDVEIVSVNGK